MVVTTLSPKHQTTLAMEIVKQLHLTAGARLRQWVEGNRIILEPLPDIMDSFGSLPKPEGMAIPNSPELDEAMEMFIAREVMGLERDD
ncbi:MAG: AbrB/MazE/SpoVT family DNA-binding domain-containing protein [Verrucomicrobiaceae bacterium]|nr:AbrB/MazE/SpoVT family DNA-binding domain-containing protein [Verrucomicrobiaceae bacterium]